MHEPTAKSLYSPAFEKDSCGFGLIAHMDGQASHWLVATAIRSLQSMTHRGGVAADGKTGDGCGLLLKMPVDYMRTKAAEAGIKTQPRFAVGTVFLNSDPERAATGKRALETELLRQGLEPAGWREVPINAAACGEVALHCLPRIEQIFVNANTINPLANVAADETEQTQAFESALFIARRRAEKVVATEMGQDDTFYVTSLSSRIINYKGLVMPENLPAFYEDLNDSQLETSICVFHQRFSTNTLPQWRLAHPFRFLAHNGEINTIQGNRNWTNARTHLLRAPQLPDLSDLSPLVSMTGSDSCSLDNMLEVLLAGGLDIFHAMRLLIPPAWQNVGHFDPELRAFYRYHSMCIEPWDGPAGIVLTDGRYAACVLDRNGLRPARYVITKDRHITLASEIGVYDYPPEQVQAKGRLKPGEMIAADTLSGELLLPQAIDTRLKSAHPYREWLTRNLQQVTTPIKDDYLVESPLPQKELTTYEKMFGVTFEEKDQVVRVLAEAGQEAVGSMGDDAPLPVLSRHERLLSDSFRQQFAQVTNPPIDSLREQIVMSLETCLGHECNPFDKQHGDIKRTLIESPVLSEYKFRQILALDSHKADTLQLNIPTEIALKTGIEQLCERAVEAVSKQGVELIVLSDKDIQRERTPINALLACGAVHHRLIKEKLRCHTNIIVETGFARDPHQFATLIGYGATAVFPYLAYQLLADMQRSGKTESAADAAALGSDYRQGINKGLYKIMSKMGISTIMSYRGAQLFEIVGLHDEVVNLCFKGTTSRVQGADFKQLHDDQLRRAWGAWNPRKPVQQGGLLKYVHGSEYHAYNPDVIQSLHRAVQSGDYEDYQTFATHVNQRPPIVLRDLLKLKTSESPIGLEEVEPIEAILPRFDSAGMSLGALSPDAHETLAQAMNRLGGRSNSGEGGEDPARYGSDKSSKIKQVASGRFGVTPHYLVNAEVLQIKIAQGAKPGEGGQLPGHKVNAMIAKLRYSNEGISLISPPPHHDIYSIEDLAQLIFDLKQVNPDALVSVKLVAEAGVGTIAAGVAKAYADLITISGYDGGTGASPLTSIKYAGVPWELGLAETSQVLRANGLRGKVRLQTDGGLKTGLDVIKAAMLGAESFGFGTAPMVAMGCKYLRICHLNNCATGVATQNEVLRLRHFIGKTEMVMNYFKFVAQETREWMAKLGVTKLEDLIANPTFLEATGSQTEKQQRLDLTPLLNSATAAAGEARFCTQKKNTPLDRGDFAERIVTDTLDTIDKQCGGNFCYTINNTHRSIGARVSCEIAKRYGNYGMQDAPLKLSFTGTAGQSFGAWNAGGLHLHLEGDANDYVGKGMAGGEIVLRPPAACDTLSNETPIAGNTCLYGATGGKFFAAGLAGERFAVRNSGAIAVVEGVGDHGCEYMTGGVVAVLGATGLNFGAGMTGGFAWVLDKDNHFNDCCNHSLVELQRIDSGKIRQQQYLHALLDEHVEKTGSVWGQAILDDFFTYLPLFYLVKPKAVELDTLISNLHEAA